MENWWQNENNCVIPIEYCGKIGDGFIILSEILVQIYMKNLKIDETSSIFINRKRGESSVSFLLICQSFFITFKATKVFGHKSSIHKTLGQLFNFEKNAEVIPTVTGDNWKAKTISNFLFFNLKYPKKIELKRKLT